MADSDSDSDDALKAIEEETKYLEEGLAMKEKIFGLKQRAAEIRARKKAQASQVGARTAPSKNNPSVIPATRRGLRARSVRKITDSPIKIEEDSEVSEDLKVTTKEYDRRASGQNYVVDLTDNTVDPTPRLEVRSGSQGMQGEATGVAQDGSKQQQRLCCNEGESDTESIGGFITDDGENQDSPLDEDEYCDDVPYPRFCGEGDSKLREPPRSRYKGWDPEDLYTAFENPEYAMLVTEKSTGCIWELHCCVCGANCRQTRQSETFFKGPRGLLAHYSKVHTEYGITARNLVQWSRFRSLDSQDADAVNSSRYEAFKVQPRLGKTQRQLIIEAVLLESKHESESARADLFTQMGAKLTETGVQSEEMADRPTDAATADSSAGGCADLAG